MTSDIRVHDQRVVILEGGGWGYMSKSRTPLKVIFYFFYYCRYPTNHLLDKGTSGSLFCGLIIGVLSNFAIILLRNRELVALF